MFGSCKCGIFGQVVNGIPFFGNTFKVKVHFMSQVGKLWCRKGDSAQNERGSIPTLGEYIG